MSGDQQAYMARVIAGAKRASDAAKPALLRALDDPELRRGLITHCLAGLVKLDAEGLLGWWDGHLAVAEVAHNFDAALNAGWKDRRSHLDNDPPLSVYAHPDARWFFNLWTPCVLNMT